MEKAELSHQRTISSGNPDSESQITSVVPLPAHVPKPLLHLNPLKSSQSVRLAITSNIPG